MESHTNQSDTVSRCINDALSRAGGYIKHILAETCLPARIEILGYLYVTHLKGVVGKVRVCFKAFYFKDNIRRNKT